MLYNFVQQQQEKGNKDLGKYLISISVVTQYLWFVRPTKDNVALQLFTTVEEK